MNVVGLPNKVYLTRGEVLGSGVGVTKRSLKKAIDMGVLVAHVFPGCTWKRFRRKEVIEAFGCEE